MSGTMMSLRLKSITHVHCMNREKYLLNEPKVSDNVVTFDV